jgi:hypothetical protein
MERLRRFGVPTAAARISRYLVLHQAVAACKALPLCGSRSYGVFLETATPTIMAAVLHFPRLRRDIVVPSLVAVLSWATSPAVIR